MFAGAWTNVWVCNHGSVPQPVDVRADEELLCSLREVSHYLLYHSRIFLPSKWTLEAFQPPRTNADLERWIKVALGYEHIVCDRLEGLEIL